MEATLFAKATDPSYEITCVSLWRQVAHRAQTIAEGKELAGFPASWLIESLVWVQSFEKRVLVVVAKFGAIGWPEAGQQVVERNNDVDCLPWLHATTNGS